MTEKITSRKNPVIRRFRALAREREARADAAEFLCEGEKLLSEAIRTHAHIPAILVREDDRRTRGLLLPETEVYTVGSDLLTYVSALENSPGPIFSVAADSLPKGGRPSRAIVLDRLQDPGNVGTILRTASAFGIDRVILHGASADPLQPKAVRSSMGAVFKVPFTMTGSDEELAGLLSEWELPLYGTLLSPESEDIRRTPLGACAVAIGNEGRGLSEGVQRLCRRMVIIPMRPDCESLNAAAAAAVVMWEMVRGN